MSEQTNTLGFILIAWTIFYFLAKQMKLDEKGWEIAPYYALYKSTRLNDIIKSLELDILDLNAFPRQIDLQQLSHPNSPSRKARHPLSKPHWDNI